MNGFMRLRKLDLSDAALLPPIRVHKTPTCGCCNAWDMTRNGDHYDLGQQ